MAEYMEWCDSLEIGIKTIDEEHKHLITLFNCAVCACEQDSYSFETLIDLLEELIHYSKYHFQNEEVYMLKHTHKLDPNYIKSHEDEHRLFNEKVLYFANKVTKDGERYFMNEIADYISSWVVNHIKTIDIKLKYIE